MRQGCRSLMLYCKGKRIARELRFIDLTFQRLLFPSMPSRRRPMFARKRTFIRLILIYHEICLDARHGQVLKTDRIERPAEEHIQKSRASPAPAFLEAKKREKMKKSVDKQGVTVYNN